MQTLIKAVLAVSLLVAGGHAAVAEKRVALVIGNAKCEAAPLAKTLNEADDIAAELWYLQFDVTKAEGLTIRDFDQGLDEFIANA
jgi:uncharacterized caspase-like protein